MQTSTFSFLALCATVALNLHPVMANEPAAAPAPETELEKIEGALYRSGTVSASIDGKDHQFVCTSQTLGTDLGEKVAAQTDHARAAAIASKLAGKAINTAVVRPIANFLFVTIDSYGTDESNIPVKMGNNRTSLEINFALDPKTLKLVENQRRLSYCAPGVRIAKAIEGKTIEVTLDEVTPLPGGALALKGSFSGTLDSSERKKIATPIAVKGTFDIQRASGNDALSKILSVK